MKPEDLINALNDIDYSMIEEAEENQKILALKLREKKTVLLAAILALFLCGTAATAGLLWIKPDVRPEGNSLTVYMREGYIELPEDKIQTILDTRIPERNNNCILTFDTFAEWQEFLDIPLVTSELLDTPQNINTFFTVKAAEEKLKLMSMLSLTTVERFFGEECSDVPLWSGSITITAAVSADAVEREDSAGVTDGKAEIIEEYTTSSGIPCVIGKIVSEKNAQNSDLFLYYGYESVMYQLWVDTYSPEEEAMILEDLKVIADTLQIVYPAEK